MVSGCLGFAGAAMLGSGAKLAAAKARIMQSASRFANTAPQVCPPRVNKDMRLWKRTGITEEHINRMFSMCSPGINSTVHPNCHVDDGFFERLSPRFLVSGGNVYLTHLPAKSITGHPDVIGFMLELYELSRLYQLPDMEIGYYAQDEAMLGQDVALAFGQPDWGVGKVQGAEGPLPLVVFSKKDINVGLTVGCYSSIRCTSDFDAMYPRMEAGGLLHPVRGRLCMYGGRAAAALVNGGAGYLVSTDGWSISPKLERYMLMGATVLKSKSDRISWFYDALKPWVHYVPFMEENSTDIIQMVEWLRTHDAEAEQMAKAAVELAVTLLHKDSRMCYLFSLFSEFSKHFRYKPTCDKRKMCVPLVEEIKWLAKHRPDACKYTELLYRFANHDPLSVGFTMDLTPFHEDPRFYPWPDGVRGNAEEPDYKKGMYGPK
ncbi:KDEL motif-containing protein 1 [Tetrabaena socialis]|uniref:KDEL motif-containing protein 1 n=1 Tax=Tetrabaena socialis TaxID=47790 RepID=A0A2J8A5N1_9CHLO|nr:KDEL motif-containing protein 1 [Tetrabaena socialis]|eukprot:PNH07818.1 KDEL motif-containing protein 1 [Tetrabaena socialis]